MLEQLAKERVLLKRIREKCITTSKPAVSIITPTVKHKCIDNIFRNFINLNYPSKELIIILNNNYLNIDDYKLKALGLKDVRILQLDESCSLGECLNYGIEKSRYDYISKMDDDDYYGHNYLLDLMNVFNYTDAEVTGKASRFVYFTDTATLGTFTPDYEYRYVNNVGGGTIVFKKHIFEKIKFRNLNIAEDNYFFSDCINAGFKIFSSDRFNYVYIRNYDLKNHTWLINQDELFKTYVTKVMETKNFIQFITV